MTFPAVAIGEVAKARIRLLGHLRAARSELGAAVHLVDAMGPPFSEDLRARLLCERDAIGELDRDVRQHGG